MTPTAHHPLRTFSLAGILLPCLVLALAAFALTGCWAPSTPPSPGASSVPSTSPGGGSASVSSSAASSTTSSTPATTTAPPTPAAPATVAVTVFLTRENRLAAAGPRVALASTPAMNALVSLLSGPSTAEVRYGLATSIPKGTSVASLKIVDGIAVVDLDKTFVKPASKTSLRNRLAQVVFTLTQFSNVSRVSFMIAGKRLSSLGGVDLSAPVDRTVFEARLPAIMITSPLPGKRIHSPLTASGTANVFEARFRLELHAPNGKRLVASAVKATSGTGTRGTFSAKLAFATSQHGEGWLVAFEFSAKDGSPVNSVRIPVRF